MMKKLVLITSLVLTSVSAFAQAFELPHKKLTTKDDYATYEQTVIESVNWLINTPAGQDPATRKSVNAFLIEWVSGSPTVTVEMNEKVVTFLDSPDYLVLFLGGWSRYVLETQDNTNKVKGNLAGVEAVLAYYQQNRNVLGKNKALEKYVKLQEKGELEGYIASKIKA